MARRTFIIGAALLLATTAVAHQGVQNHAVKARMEGMSAIGGHIKTLGNMAKGKTAFDAQTARSAAEGLKQDAARIPLLFEAMETDPKSEARGAIWDNFADFTGKAQELEAAAGAAESVSTLDDLRAALPAIGAACTSCHKAYRE